MPLPAPFSPADSPLFLMDGNAYIYRGFYANSNLQRSDGFPTGALSVVSRILVGILKRERPRYFAFLKDGHGGNFRHGIYPQYKANRQAPPDALVAQLEPIRRMVEALGLRFEESRGCEADDCIASLAARFSKERPAVIVSADKDLRQCLGPRVVMWDAGAREERILTAEKAEAEFGVPVSRWADFQALTGDSTDNIPGVPGIGPKTAAEILRDFRGLEDIRDRYELVSPKHRKRLDGHLEEMFVWRRLTALAVDRCEDVTLEDLEVRPVDVEKAVAVAREFEMRSLVREIEALARRSPAGSGPAFAPVPGTPAPAKAPAPDRDEGVALSAKAGPSLLDVARSAGVSALRPLSDPADLPPCGGAHVAAVWTEGPQGPCAVAAKAGGETVEFLWRGDPSALAAWSAPAAALVVVDAKSLLAPGCPWKGEVLRRIGEGTLHDLGLAAYLFNPEEQGLSLERIAGQASLREEAAGGPGALALALREWGRERLARDGLAPLYDGMELPLVPVLASMEEEGILIDMAAFGRFLGDVRQEIAGLEQRIYEDAGERFNLRSSQKLGEILYGRLGLKSTRKTKGGQQSTSQEVLEGLAGRHPVVDGILRYRKLEKLRSTYLEPLPRLTDAAGRLHTTFNQEATATGRLSSSDPNLQNIPVRDALGRRMRSCFTAKPGHMLVSCDYSQIELRVLAFLSADEALLGAFRAGEDIHARTAALIYGLAPDEVTKDQRRNAKTINFGLLYGMGSQKLAREIGVTPKEAKAFIARYFENLSGLKAFYERVEADARRDGFVTTMGGRRRLLPGIGSENQMEQALARRQAVNTVIQGSAADVIKIAMLAVHGDADLRSWGARLLLQVHDELVLEVPEARAEDAARRVVSLMESAAPGGVAIEPGLKVDWGMGRDWGAAH